MIVWSQAEHPWLPVVLEECMAKGGYEVTLIIDGMIMTVLSDDIVVIDEPLQEDDRLSIIEWTFRRIRLHMPLVERDSDDLSELWRCQELEYFSWRIHSRYFTLLLCRIVREKAKIIQKKTPSNWGSFIIVYFINIYLLLM